MIRFFYTLIGYLIQPVLFLLLWKKHGKLPARWQERYGFYSGTVPKTQGVVIHAASVGEVIAVTPLVKQLLQDYPDLPITLTTFTETGAARVQANFGEAVTHRYLPYDLPDAVKRFLDFTQPKLFILTESELWPNLIAQVKGRDIPFVMANARLSNRSTARYLKFKGMLEPMLKQIFGAMNLVLAQDEVSANNYLALGVPSSRVINTGNLKFDIHIPPTLREVVAQTRETWKLSNRPVWIAASTHQGEEEIVLSAHQQLLARHPELLLIIVPRHPERFREVEQLLQERDFLYCKRSEKTDVLPNHQVLLGDSMGELLFFYGLANIAFVGGSLIPRGGHNPLEPIAFDVPVISGMHTFNFLEIFAKLRQVNGVLEIDSQPEALAEVVEMLLSHHATHAAVSQAAKGVLRANQGAREKQLALLNPYLLNQSQ